MKFHPTPISGAHLIELEPRGDARGYFARAYCEDEFAAAGIEVSFVQANMSKCEIAGTFRGLHYQRLTHPEAKFLRCIHGAVYDVIVDMRKNSPSYLKSYGVELSAENKKAIYVPPGVAHGYLALSAGAEVFYLVSHRYAPEAEAGLRYDDPAIDLTLPIAIEQLSDKDKVWPDIIPGESGEA